MSNHRLSYTEVIEIRHMINQGMSDNAIRVQTEESIKRIRSVRRGAYRWTVGNCGKPIIDASGTKASNISF